MLARCDPLRQVLQLLQRSLKGVGRRHNRWSFFRLLPAMRQGLHSRIADAGHQQCHKCLHCRNNCGTAAGGSRSSCCSSSSASATASQDQNVADAHCDARQEVGQNIQRWSCLSYFDARQSLDWSRHGLQEPLHCE